MVDVSEFDFEHMESVRSPRLSNEGGSLPEIKLPEPIMDDLAVAILAIVYQRLDDPEKLVTLLTIENEIQEEYMKDDLYKSTIIRQAAFVEYFLNAHLKYQFETLKGESLSNSKQDFLFRTLGNTSRMNIVSMLGIFSQPVEQALNELISARNDLAHTPWIAFSTDSEERFERTAKRMHNIFERFVKDRELIAEVSEDILTQLDD